MEFNSFVYLHQLSRRLGGDLFCFPHTQGKQSSIRAGRQAGTVSPSSSLPAITDRLSALTNKFSRAVSIDLFSSFSSETLVKYIHERLGAYRFGRAIISFE